MYFPRLRSVVVNGTGKPQGEPKETHLNFKSARNQSKPASPFPRPTRRYTSCITRNIACLLHLNENKTTKKIIDEDERGEKGIRLNRGISRETQCRALCFTFELRVASDTTDAKVIVVHVGRDRVNSIIFHEYFELSRAAGCKKQRKEKKSY